MVKYTLSFKPALELFGSHDPSAAIFRDGSLIYGVEEERLIRKKHATGIFPINSIQSCLDYADVKLHELEKIFLPYDPGLHSRRFFTSVKQIFNSDRPLLSRIRQLERECEGQAIAKVAPTYSVTKKLAEEFGTPVPEVAVREHHACHAASAFHPSGYDEALVLTLDGAGEYDSTVVWTGDSESLNRVETYEYPNSLGHFFGAVTKFLGYRAFNGEGKIMGLAPYGSKNKHIEGRLREIANFGLKYDVTGLTSGGMEEAVNRLENLFNKSKRSDESGFSQWEKDLAYTAQSLLEETVTDIVDFYCNRLSKNKVCLAGGVALNCKMNKAVMEHSSVNELFIQPVAHDGGLAVGGGLVDQKPKNVSTMESVYLGPEYEVSKIEQSLEENKISYDKPNNLFQRIAQLIANGKLVGWFRGRLEMGPRALGHRSILADPRTANSRDRVNKHVKHREEWRPFAPSILEEAAEEYLINGSSSPFMIQTFEVREQKSEDICAVLHPGDNTTRPQTVSQENNPHYYKLISELEKLTGVPVVLNTSFNDHAEPIVNTPTEAIKDFFGMGLDVLVLEDLVVKKTNL